MTDAATPESSLASAMKSLEKLNASVASGDLYGALQHFKTAHARSKKKGQIVEAIELARGGAELMLQNKEVNAGGDLSRDFVALLKAATKEQRGDEALRVTQLVALDALFAQIDGVDSARERKRFMKAAVEYSAETGSWSFGDPQLHRAMGLAAMKESDYPSASKHYLHAMRPDELAAMLVKWSKALSPADQDLVLARGVLQLLCLENLRDANTLYQLFQAQQNLNTPLTRFLAFLLKTLERDAYPLFQVLRQKYAKEIARTDAMGSSSFNSYLDKIAEVFYKVAPPKNQGNMFAQMMQNLMM